MTIARVLAIQPDGCCSTNRPARSIQMRDEVMAVIRDLAQGGMTMLVVTHETQFAHDIASRIFVIDRRTIAPH